MKVFLSQIVFSDVKIKFKYSDITKIIFMIEQGLQQEINMVMTEARNRRLEFVTVEHLLLALLNMDEVISFLRGKARKY